LKNYYELLEITDTAPLEEVKRAFRQQIALYHPDKVHHLGKEFQEIAATRAADLTEAYRILSHEDRRREYDAQLNAAAVAAPAAAPAPRAPESSAAPPPPAGAGAQRPQDHDQSAPKGAQFDQERASRDAFVRKAILDRFRQALAQVVGSTYDESPVRGFDISFAPRAKMFAKSKGPRLLGRFVARVDGPSVAEAWTSAGKLNLPADQDVCVILMGIQLAPQRELAHAIAEQRRRARGRKLTLIPGNASGWDAHMPTDAPDVAKTLLTRLRSGS
jgi:curved DNA-binding protein CbpA